MWAARKAWGENPIKEKAVPEGGQLPAKGKENVARAKEKRKFATLTKMREELVTCTLGQGGRRPKFSYVGRWAHPPIRRVGITR